MANKRIHPQGVPLVSHLARAAELLEVPMDDLARAVDGAALEAWGKHANGSPVFKWSELLAAARAAGLRVPTPRARLRWNGKAV